VTPETRPRVSIVIPTLDEEAYLPGLLDDIERQTFPVHEVIIADAGSRDATVRIARSRGVKVTEGGLPGVGRNHGALAASGSWLLFLDADVRLAPDALEQALTGMARERLTAASCWFAPDSNEAFLRFNHWISSHYFRLSSKLGWPHSIGAFLLLKRAEHHAIGGFDPTVTVAEDQDYVRRLARRGKYGFLRHPVVIVATRRFAAHGGLRMSLKWLGIELHRLFLGEIRGNTFRYFP